MSGGGGGANVREAHVGIPKICITHYKNVHIIISTKIANDWERFRYTTLLSTLAKLCLLTQDLLIVQIIVLLDLSY